MRDRTLTPSREPLNGRRRRVLAVVTTLALVAGIASAVALAGDEPFVFDPMIGETVPAELVDGLREAIGDPSSPGGDGGELVPEPPAEAPPAPYAASITPVNGDGNTPPPFAAHVLEPTNAWSEGTATSARIVYAGEDDDGHGALIDMTLTYDDGAGDEAAVTWDGPGPLTITTSSGGSLSISGPLGWTGTYELATKELTMRCPRFAACRAGP